MQKLHDALKSQLCSSLLSPLGNLCQLPVWPGLNLARSPGPGQVLVLPGAAAAAPIALDALLMMEFFPCHSPSPCWHLSRHDGSSWWKPWFWWKQLSQTVWLVCVSAAWLGFRWGCCSACPAARFSWGVEFPGNGPALAPQSLPSQGKRKG